MLKTHIIFCHLTAAISLALACGGSSTSTPDASTLPEGGPDADSGPQDAGDAGPDVAGSDGAADASPCGPNEHLCSGTCYPNDIAHCGASCVACGAPMYGEATCNGTQCGYTCNVAQCGQTCTDPMNDPKNCGGCGHDCKGANCSSGLCQPVSVVSGLPHGPWGLAVDANNIYWTEWYGGTRVMQAPLLGGASTVITNSASDPLYIAVDAMNIYYEDTNGLSKAPIGSTNNVTNIVGQTIVGPFRIDAINAYYVTYPDYMLYSVPLTGGASTALLSVSACTNAFALDATNAYWTKYDCSTVSTIYQQTRSGDAGTPITLASALPGEGSDIAVDATTVYVTLGGIYSVPIGGGKTTMLTGSSGTNIVLDGPYLYWGDMGAHTVLKMPRSGGAATVLAYDQMQQPTNVATDANYVYWTTSGPEAGIYKTPK